MKWRMLCVSLYIVLSELGCILYINQEYNKLRIKTYLQNPCFINTLNISHGAANETNRIKNKTEN